MGGWGRRILSSRPAWAPVQGFSQRRKDKRKEKREGEVNCHLHGSMKAQPPDCSTWDVVMFVQRIHTACASNLPGALQPPQLSKRLPECHSVCVSIVLILLNSRPKGYKIMTAVRNCFLKKKEWKFSALWVWCPGSGNISLQTRGLLNTSQKSVLHAI